MLHCGISQGILELSGKFATFVNPSHDRSSGYACCFLGFPQSSVCHSVVTAKLLKTFSSGKQGVTALVRAKIMFCSVWYFLI